MKTRIKKLVFEGSYIIPVIILNIMIWIEIFNDNRRVILLLLSIPLSFCVGISAVNFIKEIVDFKLYLKTRDQQRVTGLDICPKCKGSGWLDWVEQITGKRGVVSKDEQSS
jgi:hypothetical protein